MTEVRRRYDEVMAPNILQILLRVWRCCDEGMFVCVCVVASDYGSERGNSFCPRERENNFCPRGSSDENDSRSCFCAVGRDNNFCPQGSSDRTCSWSSSAYVRHTLIEKHNIYRIICAVTSSYLRRTLVIPSS